MDKFDWTKLTLRIPVKADKKSLYEAWSQSGKLEQWFLSSADYKSGNDLLDKTKNAKTGDVYEWSWFNWPHSESGTVIIANGHDEFGFTFAGECRTIVKLLDHGDETLVEITQSEIPTDDESKLKIRLGCESGWSFYLVNLKSILEGGIDLRNKKNTPVSLINN